MNVDHSNDNASVQHPPLFGIPANRPELPSSILRDALQSGDWTARLVTEVADLVGGIDELEALDHSPLATTPFDWSVVAADDRGAVTAVIAEIDAHGHQLLDEEYVSIVHRLIERVASANPKALHRGDAPRTAAAFVWLALHGNGHFIRSKWERADHVWIDFGVSSCAQRGRGLFRAAGFKPLSRQRSFANQFIGTSDVWLGEVGLLHSRTRARLIEQRAMVVRGLEEEVARREAARPIQPVGDGKLLIRARPITPRWATRTATEVGRALVLVGVGENDDDFQVLALSVPDARQLVTSLQVALDGTPPVSR